LLGSPLLARAYAESAESACECARRAYRKYYDQARQLEDDLFFDPPAAVALIALPAFLTAYAGLTAGTYAGQLYHCGVAGADCKKVPSGDPPNHPPNFGGYEPAPPSASGCAPGTRDCGGGDLCCFGDDLCCGECCCIKEVGCGCCGGERQRH
jgi:hypothetical protein